MADDTRYREALARRGSIMRQMAKLQSELAAIEEFVRLYDQIFISDGLALGDKADATIIRSIDRRDEMQTAQKRERNILSPGRIVEMCKEFIIQEKRPMTRSELLNKFYALGIPLAGNDPAKNLGTILWRSKRFEHVDKEGYWPAGVARPLLSA